MEQLKLLSVQLTVPVYMRRHFTTTTTRGGGGGRTSISIVEVVNRKKL